MHLAIIIPHGYRGGTLRGAFNIARMLKLGAQRADQTLQISFGHLDDRTVYRSSDFDLLRAEGITVRPFKPEFVNDQALAWHYDATSVSPNRRAPKYLVFNDGIANFEDCDYWLIVSDRIG